MQYGKLNCWEYKKCGREQGGRLASGISVCPAASDASFDGINSGENGGRFCWAVAGTCCAGKVQGTYAEKRESCMDCEFYKTVCAEEGTANLRTKLLRFVPPGCGRSILRDMTLKHIKKGERFINQGDRGDASYIIQRGSALVVVEKDGEFHPVDHREEGDILGMSALFTGEPRHAHRPGIVHRDINPDNIFVQKNSRVKLLDFGVACPIGTDDYFSGGAMPYLAPELLDGDPADQRSDIYSLGITAYELVTGKRPYPEDNTGDLIKIKRSMDIPDPSERVSGLPQNLCRFICKSCIRDPDKRYQDMAQGLDDLLTREEARAFSIRAGETI